MLKDDVQVTIISVYFYSSFAIYSVLSIDKTAYWPIKKTAKAVPYKDIIAVLGVFYKAKMPYLGVNKPNNVFLGLPKGRIGIVNGLFKRVFILSSFGVNYWHEA